MIHMFNIFIGNTPDLLPKTCKITYYTDDRLKIVTLMKCYLNDVGQNEG